MKLEAATLLTTPLNGFVDEVGAAEPAPEAVIEPVPEDATLTGTKVVLLETGYGATGEITGVGEDIVGTTIAGLEVASTTGLEVAQLLGLRSLTWPQPPGWGKSLG